MGKKINLNRKNNQSTLRMNKNTRPTNSHYESGYQE